MRHSICYTEPAFAIAGETNNWQFIYTPAHDLPKGTKIQFDLGSSGRDIDWEFPSANLKDKSNVIFALMGKSKILPAKVIQSKQSPIPLFEFTLPDALKATSPFVIVVGSPKFSPFSKSAASKSEGSKTQLTSQRRRTFQLLVDSAGKGKNIETEQFHMDVKGGELTYIRVLSPSLVARNKRFDIVLRFEDQYGNLTGLAPEETLIELSYDHLRENLNWKLFVPETGFITLPNLYFNEPGTYTINFSCPKLKKKFQSPPIKCLQETSSTLFWGLFHGESERYDSTENIESCERHFRDERALNFYGVSPFESQEETPNETWKTISQTVTDFNEEDRFVTFLGFQWEGEPVAEGARLFVWAKDQKSIIRKKENRASLQKLYKSFSPKELIAIPLFTMAKGHSYNFDLFHPEFERVVEIYNSWGSSECTQKEGNPLPIEIESKKGISETKEGSLIAALNKGCRFGFVAGGLDDRGFFSPLFENGQIQYPPGMTAIYGEHYSRASFFEALYNRSCYATTGERIILGFSIAGLPMGKETSTHDKHGLIYNRHLSGFAAGTAPLATLEIIRNGEVLKTMEPSGSHFDFTFDDMDPIKKVALPGKNKAPPFVYYYIRVTQEDGHMAWSSPIWIDVVDSQPVSKFLPKKTQKGKGAELPSLTSVPKESLVENEEEEDEDFEEEEEEDGDGDF